MSAVTKQASNKTVTIWLKRTTGFGNEKETTYQVVTTQACYMQGGGSVRTDACGTEFSPQSTYWFEVLDENPTYGGYIALGDQSAIDDPTNADKAEVIRVDELQDCSLLNDIDDLKVIT